LYTSEIGEVEYQHLASTQGITAEFYQFPNFLSLDLDAALDGSQSLNLPKPFQYCTFEIDNNGTNNIK